MESSKSAFWLAVAAIVIAVGAYWYPHAAVAPSNSQDSSFGEIGTRYPNGIYVGSIAAGVSKVSGITFGTCSLISGNYTIAASSTATMDCAAAGALPTDTIIFSQFATTTGTTLGWTIQGISASSTAGFLTLKVANQTGASATIPASVASTTPWLIYR